MEGGEGRGEEEGVEGRGGERRGEEDATEEGRGGCYEGGERESAVGSRGWVLCDFVVW